MIVVANSDHRNMIVGKPISEEEELILLESLGSAGLRSSTYITPLVKCGSLTGNIKNAKICVSWIYKEIEIIQPKCILFLGNSLQKFYDMDWPINKILFCMSATRIFRAGKKDRNIFVGHLMEIKNWLNTQMNHSVNA